MVGGEVIDLALADAVLAGAGAAAGERALDQPVEKLLHLAPLFLVGGIDQRHDMEIAVAHMAYDRCEQPQAVDVLMRGADRSGKSGDGHAHIGGHELGAGPERARGPIGVVARLPESVAVLLARRPLQLPSPFGARDLGEAFDLLAGSGFAAVELEEERRLLGQRAVSYTHLTLPTIY